MSQEVFSLDDLEGKDFSFGSKDTEVEDRVPYLPTKNQKYPFDVRVLINPIASELGKPYHDAHIHPIPMGSKWVNVPCPRAIGKSCYMCDISWKAKEEYDKLVNKGASDENHPMYAEYKKQEILSNKYKQRKQYIFIAALREDPKLYFYYAGPALIKQIFGDKKKNIAGALQGVREYGVTLFSPKEPTGWISVNKTGQKLDTVYTARPSTIVTIENRKKNEVILEEHLHNDILKRFENVADLPKALESFKNRMWSEEEMIAFVDSDGLQIPKKLQAWVGLIPEVPTLDKPAKTVDTAGNASIEDFDPF